MRGTLLIGMVLCFAGPAFGQSGWRVDVVAATGAVQGLRGFSCVVTNDPMRLNGGNSPIGPATIIPGDGPVQLGGVTIQHRFDVTTNTGGMHVQLTSRPLEAEARTPVVGYRYGAAGPIAPFTLDLDDRLPIPARRTTARLLITPIP